MHTMINSLGMFLSIKHLREKILPNKPTRFIVTLLCVFMTAELHSNGGNPVSSFLFQLTQETQTHERLTPRELDGINRTLTVDPVGDVELFVPSEAPGSDTVDVVVHFHGASWLVNQSVSDLRSGTVAAVVNLGSGSGVYHRSFTDPEVFDSLLANIKNELSAIHGRPVQINNVILTAFSAGHGAVRVILREERHFERIAAVLIMDGMHTSYVPEGTLPDKGGEPDTTNLTAFARFAGAAIAGRKTFLITHSEIKPETYASTTETADWLLHTLGLQRAPLLRPGPRGMRQLSEAKAGSFAVLGFAGDTAPDHIDHFHAMPELLARILNMFCNDTTRYVSGEEYLLHWEVESNYIDQNRFRSQYKLVNKSVEALDSDWTLYFNFMRMVDAESVPPYLQLTHINGDFYKINPTDKFEPLAPGKELEFTLEARGSAIKRIDAPDGAYFEFTDGSIVPVRVIVGDFVREEQLNRNRNDVLPVITPEYVYTQNNPLSKLPADEIGEITPSPVSVKKQDVLFSLTPETKIYFQDSLENEARFLSMSLEPLLNARLPFAESSGSSTTSSIHLMLGEVNIEEEIKISGDEAYVLSVSEERIVITGSDASGVFYGIQSLRSLLPLEVWKSPGSSIFIGGVLIEDAPGFGYRGLHLDVSRNFQSVETVKRLLDVMAFYKLNKFHFHLTDDEGWRLAINAFPELTEVGGRRGHTHDERDYLIPSFGSGPYPDVSMGSGWYTQDDYIDILRYATERHIEVIPEIDVPGHARAALIAMQARYDRLMEEGKYEEADRYRIHDPEDGSEYMSVQRWKDNVINVCQESTYRFLGVVFDEIIEMHRAAAAPLTSIHIGGDEVPRGVWVDSPQCLALLDRSPDLDMIDQLQVWFFGRMKQMLEERDIVMSGWEEIALVGYYGGEKQLNPEFAGESIAYVWSNVWGVGTEGFSYTLANAGYEIVISHASDFYFNLAYNKHPDEAGQYWAGFVDTRDPFLFIPFNLYKSGIENYMGQPIPQNTYDDFEQLTLTGKENILGLQGHLWGATLSSYNRVEYMAIPRIISLAERSWVPYQEWMDIQDRAERLTMLEEAWNEFANRLGQRELRRLDGMNGGYAYRIPPPGAIIENNKLRANVSYPGLEIRYTNDGSKPTVNSSRYVKPVTIDENMKIKLRAFDTRGRGSRVVVLD